MQRAREIVCICVGGSGHACLHPLMCLYVCERASGYVDVCYVCMCERGNMRVCGFRCQDVTQVGDLLIECKFAGSFHA